jgi:LysR family transcriptional regulator, hydrogen peroxide-inducible genes activator
METRPTVRQLEYLVAVAEAGHFGRAARACAVTQPALSAQIAALEQALGVRLFERSRRGARPTRAGERVVERARTTLRSVDELIAVAREAREPLTGPLHLGVIPTVAPYLLPRWLPEVRRRHPRLRLFLHEEQTAGVLAGLAEGRLDLGLLALPIAAPALESFSVGREPFLLAVPSSHPLAKRRARVGEAEIRGESVLLLEDGHCLRDQALSICHEAGAREAEGVRASSLSTLVQMVEGGLGVTLLPASAAAVEGRGDLALLRFRAPEPSRELGLVWRRSSARGDEFRLLGELLRRRLGRGAGAVLHTAP